MVKNLASLARGRDVTGGYNSDSKKVHTRGVCIGADSTSLSSDNVVVGQEADAGKGYISSFSPDGEFIKTGEHVVIGSNAKVVGATEFIPRFRSVVVGALAESNGNAQVVIGANSAAGDAEQQNVIGYNINNQTGGGNHNTGTYINPIRTDPDITHKVVTYNTTTKELTHSGISLDPIGQLVQDLQSVTDTGNTTTNEMTVIGSVSGDLITYTGNYINIVNSKEAVCIGTGAIGSYNSATSTGGIMIGKFAGGNQGESAVAIGVTAGPNQQPHAIAIGDTAGGRGGMNSSSIAIGYQTGTTSGIQPGGSVCIGLHAQTQVDSTNAIAIGSNADVSGPGEDSIAIGNRSNISNKGAIAIGRNANVSGENTIAIGLDAVGTADNAFYVSRIRDDFSQSNTAEILAHGNQGEIIEIGNIDVLVSNSNPVLELNANLNDSISLLQDGLDVHIDNHKTGEVSNGYKVQSGDGSNLTVDLFYGGVYHFTSDGNLNLPNPTSVGMNFICTRNINVTAANLVAPAGVTVIHTNSPVTGGALTFPQNINMLKFVAVAGGLWITE